LFEQIGDLPAILNPLLSADPKKIRVGGPVHPCPSCGKAMRKRNGEQGAWWGCTGYPDCRTTAPDDGGKPGKAREAAQASEYKCPKCGSVLLHYSGTAKKSGKPYKALRCPKKECTGFFFFDKAGKPDFSGK
jgi:DNA topoisomerase-1